MTAEAGIKYLKNRFPLKLGVIFLLLSLGFAFMGYLYYANQKEEIINQVENELITISDYKANQINTWLGERLKYSNSILKNEYRLREIKEFLEEPGSPEHKKDISVWLLLAAEIYGYKEVNLFNNDLQPVITVPSNKTHKSLNNTYDKYKNPGKVYISELYQEDTASPLIIDIVVPVQYSAVKDTSQTALLVFELDAESFIFPTLLQIPSQFETMESLIAQTEDDHIIYLNELKFEKNTALKLKIHMSDSAVIAVQAARGKTGLTHGIDYRHADVFANIKKVENTPWFLITKIDTRELESPILRKTITSFLSVFFAIILTGIFITLIWRSQKVKYYKTLLHYESERKALAEHYRYLTKYANDIIFLGDTNLNIIEANNKAIECYGYTREELLKMNAKDIRTPETAGEISKMTERINKEGGWLFESMHKRKDGSTFPVEISTRLINIEGTKYYQSIIRDITERKRAEEQIRKNEIMTNAVMQNSPVGITVRSIDGRLISYNKAWQKIWNLDEKKVDELEEEHKNMTFEQRYHYFGDSVKKIKAAFEIGEHQYIPEIKVNNPYSGRELWISLYLYAVSSNGRIERIVTLTQDITEQKYIEKKLIESEKQQRSIIEHSTAVFYSHTTDYIISFISPQVKQLLDYTLEEAKTKWTEFATDNPINETGFYLTRKAIETGLPQPPYEMELIGKKGRKVWVEVHESPVVENGKTTAITGSLTDITERKKNEEKISKLNRIYRVLSEINQSIVRINNEKELYCQVCKTLADVGKFRMVWIAEFDTGNTLINNLGSAGYDNGYIDLLVSQSKYIIEENSPISENIFNKQAKIFNNLEKDLNYPWRKESIKRGYSSYCIIPLHKENSNITLNLYSDEYNFFTNEEIDLLTKLGEDISFSLNSIEHEKQRFKAEREAISASQMLEKITGTSPAYISVYDMVNDQTVYHNSSIMEKLGYSKEQLLRIWAMTSEEAESLYNPDDLDKVNEIDKKIQQLKDDEVFKTEYRLKDSTGNWHWFEHTARVFQRNETGAATQSVNIIMDINERKQSDEMVLNANRKLKILYEAGKKLGATLDLTELYNSMYEFVSMTADCHDMFVAVYDEALKNIRYTYLRSKEEDHNIDVSNIPPIPLAPPGYGILSEVIRSGKSQLFNNYQTSVKKSRVQYTVDQKGELTRPGGDSSGENKQPRSAMLVPIKLDNKVFAVVQIFSLKENAFTSEQLEIVESLMHQAALANKNVLLYKQAQEELIERIKTEEELKKSEERFSLTFRLSPIAVSLTKLDNGTIIDVNDAFSRLLGYSREEAIGLKTTDLGIWDISARTDTLAGFNNDGLIKDKEAKIKNKKGEEIDTIATLQKLKIGGVECMIAMLLDITEKKKSEERLRKLSRAVEQSPASIIITDTGGNIEYVNPKFTEVTGYTNNEVIGMNPRILKSGETPAEIYKDLWRTISGGSEWHGELHNKRKDGDLYWSWSSISPIYDSSGKITNYLAVQEDITAHKVIQDQIRLQAKLIDNMHDAIIFTDKTTKIKSWNMGAQSIYGWTAEEALGKVLPDLLVSSFFNESVQSILEIIFKNGTWKGEVAEYTKEGKPVIVLSSASGINDEKGNLIGIIIVNKDISELKLSEEKLKTSLKEKEILLKEIHHRVKNNLQVISSLLKMQSSYIKDASSLEYFKISAQRVKSMALIHEQLYRSGDLSKIDFENYVKKLTTHLFQTYGINSRSIGIKIKIKNVKLSIDTAIPLGLIVNELVSNSLKHAFPNGKKGLIEIKMEQAKEEFFVLKVKDDGVGFPKNMDFRNTETLGLQLINTLSEQVEGNIDVKNDSGTEFIINFKTPEYKKRI